MEREDHFLDVPAAEVMTRDPRLCGPDELAAARSGYHGAARRDGAPGARRWRQLVGMVHLHDLMRAGAV
jgi:hypothetical protein